MSEFDFIIIGGGIFGSYAATYLLEQGYSVCILEKENRLFSKASTVNQARIHSGYHYPRSIATAQISEEYKARFIKDHSAFINDQFTHFYAIDKFNSMTDPAQFERFCKYLEIPCRRVFDHDFIKLDRVEALFETKEFSFDPIQISNFYQQKLSNFEKLKIETSAKILKVNQNQKNWKIEIQNIENLAVKRIKSNNVISASYAGSNGILNQFGFKELDLIHEITEITMVESKAFSEIGLTVMDGPFTSIMPFGLSGFHSLSSVSYTPHEISKENKPTFSCQQKNQNCRPDFPGVCNTCIAKPSTNYDKMENQIRHYLKKTVDLKYVDSKFTVKSKLKSSFIDDGRPTHILKLKENPSFYCIFAGKINSIYEIEKVL